MGTKTFWTDDEVAELAETMHAMRAKEPQANLVHLVNRAQARFPESRRRKIMTVGQIKPILVRLTVRDGELRTLAREFENIRQAAEHLRGRPDREEILAQMSSEEILRRWGSTLAAEALQQMNLEGVLVYAARRQAAELALPREFHHFHHHEMATTPAESLPLPFVGIYGALPDQAELIAEQLPMIRLFFCPKDMARPSVPRGLMWAIVWLDFTSHSTGELLRAKMDKSRVIPFRGGVKNLVERIQGLARV